jgi:5-(carboxyamino)imidazole ribonucleotide synthase
MRVRNAAELAAAWAETGDELACALENRTFERQCSVIVARGWTSAIVAFPPQLNLHVGNILAMSVLGISVLTLHRA